MNVTGSIGGFLTEINKRIEFYTCHGKTIAQLVLLCSSLFRKASVEFVLFSIAWK